MPKHGSRKPEGSLGRTAQDGHLDSHTTPELWFTSTEARWLIRDGDGGGEGGGSEGSSTARFDPEDRGGRGLPPEQPKC